MHGVDFDAKIAEAKAKIEKANSFNMAMSHIAAAALDTLNDSHTFSLGIAVCASIDFSIVCSNRSRRQMSSRALRSLPDNPSGPASIPLELRTANGARTNSH